jgi:hypothetical protein
MGGMKLEQVQGGGKAWAKSADTAINLVYRRLDDAS